MLWKTKKSSSGTPSPSNTDPVSSQQDGKSTTFEVSPQNADGGAHRTPGSFVIPKGYRVLGSVVSSKPVVVLGELMGDSLTSPAVVVGPHGKLDIPVETNTLVVEGVVAQPVKVRDEIEVKAGGSVLADVEASSISISPGGLVSGARLAIGPLRAA